jgi:hypothetical protein
VSISSTTKPGLLETGWQDKRTQTRIDILVKLKAVSSACAAWTKEQRFLHLPPELRHIRPHELIRALRYLISSSHDWDSKQKNKSTLPIYLLCGSWSSKVARTSNAGLKAEAHQQSTSAIVASLAVFHPHNITSVALIDLINSYESWGVPFYYLSHQIPRGTAQYTRGNLYFHHGSQK